MIGNVNITNRVSPVFPKLSTREPAFQDSEHCNASVCCHAYLVTVAQKGYIIRYTQRLLYVKCLVVCVQSNAGAPYPGRKYKSTRFKTTQVISAKPTPSLRNLSFNMQRWISQINPKLIPVQSVKHNQAPARQPSQPTLPYSNQLGLVAHPSLNQVRSG